MCASTLGEDPPLARTPIDLVENSPSLQFCSVDLKRLDGGFCEPNQIAGIEQTFADGTKFAT